MADDSARDCPGPCEGGARQPRVRRQARTVDPRRPDGRRRLVRLAPPPGSCGLRRGIVRDIARRYAVDGIHLDYARYPSDRFDYSRGAVRQFRTFVRPGLSDATRRALDAREAVDLF